MASVGLVPIHRNCLGTYVTSDDVRAEAKGMATSSASDDSQDGPGGPSDGRFECNICFEQAKDAVVSMCGHLFWSVTENYTHNKLCCSQHI